tara:strand:+ start:3876 stop:4664 length:789 start_codon:yes stop_codon:yes gene_type:complete
VLSFSRIQQREVFREQLSIEQAGAKTGIAPLISAAVVGMTLLFLTPLFYYLPNAVLAAIIMVAVFGLIDFSYPISLYKTRKDEFVLLLLTFITTLLVEITSGILSGVLFSLLIMLYRISVPNIAVIARVKNTTYYKDIVRFKAFIEERDAILILRMDAPLFFGNTAIFKTTLSQNIARKGAALKLVILNMEAIGYLDSSGLHVLKDIIEDLKEKQVKLLFSGTSAPITDLLYTSGITALLGEENLFSRAHEAEEYSDANALR